MNSEESLDYALTTPTNQSPDLLHLDLIQKNKVKIFDKIFIF